MVEAVCKLSIPHMATMVRYQASDTLVTHECMQQRYRVSIDGLRSCITVARYMQAQNYTRSTLFDVFGYSCCTIVATAGLLRSRFIMTLIFRH